MSAIDQLTARLVPPDGPFQIIEPPISESIRPGVLAVATALDRSRAEAPADRLAEALKIQSDMPGDSTPFERGIALGLALALFTEGAK